MPTEREGEDSNTVTSNTTPVHHNVIVSGAVGAIHIAEYAMALVFMMIVCTAFYFGIRSEASLSQRLKDQNAIYEQIIKNQKEFFQKTQDILILQNQATEDLKKQIGDIQDSTDLIDAYLNDPDTVKEDRSSSDILKNTIKRLSGEK